MPEKTSKSLVLFVVEGRSDCIALKAPLRNLLKKRGFGHDIEVDVYGTDFLVHDINDKNNPILREPWDVQERIKKSVQRYLGEPKNKKIIKATDISCVIAISDLDACFCPESAVVQNESGCADIFYDTKQERIHCNNVEYVLRRNEAKKDAADLIVHDGTILLSGCKKAIPLGIFYFNLNIDHVLYGVNKPGMNEDEKISLAQVFRNTYAYQADELSSFLNMFLLGEAKDYATSWGTSLLKKNAFKRITNLLFLLSWLKQVNKL